MPEHDDKTGPAPHPPRPQVAPASLHKADLRTVPVGLRLLPAALILAATVLVYLPSLRNGFIWDDDFYVTDNTNLRSWSGLAAIWTQPTTSPQYYPLVFTTFWIEHHLWGCIPWAITWSMSCSMGSRR